MSTEREAIEAALSHMPPPNDTSPHLAEWFTYRSVTGPAAMRAMFAEHDAEVAALHAKVAELERELFDLKEIAAAVVSNEEHAFSGGCGNTSKALLLGRFMKTFAQPLHKEPSMTNKPVVSDAEVGAAWRALAQAPEAMRGVLEQFLASRAAQPDLPDPAYAEAVSLATSLFKKHYASDEVYTSGRVVWGPCDTTAGVLTQIDNMVCGLVMKPDLQAEPVKVRLLTQDKSPRRDFNRQVQLALINKLIVLNPDTKFEIEGDAG